MNLISRLSTIILSCSILSCNLEEEPAKELDPFDKIWCNGSVDINLIQGTTNEVVSTTLNDFSYDVSNDQLNIQAGSGSITIAIEDIESIWCQSCDITALETITLDDLSIYIHAGSLNALDLIISDTLDCEFDNMGIYTIKGSSPYVSFSMTNNAQLEAYDFIGDTVEVSVTSKEAHVHATSLLTGSIHGHSDLIYKGNPDSVNVNTFGTGEAIPY